uniref:Uncharacterized protein n=1 Tax=Periophthalmus magnuspinnatus TaxID=409849 RepID=A0A3B4BGL6_9GOBI
MADDFDVEAMLEAPYRKVGFCVRLGSRWHRAHTVQEPQGVKISGLTPTTQDVF